MRKTVGGEEAVEDEWAEGGEEAGGAGFWEAAGWLGQRRCC